MELSQLLNLSRVTHAADAAESHSRSPGRRTVKRFTQEEIEWMKANHATHTSAEAGVALGRVGAVVRKKCLALGLQLKYSDCKNSNNVKPGKQKELAKAV